MSTSKNRKLSAILFADIVGYTALMQKDETTALQIVEKFRSTLTEKVNQFNGQIINDYGDGCLCTFDTAIEAVDCAEAIQLIFQETPLVPVRIGLHSGAVYYEADNVYGDSVNIASRIESLGVAGAVLFSAKIKKEIESKIDHEAESLGSFDFKNVEEPMEVFGLANEGLVIPKRSEMQGKLKENNSFLQKIWQKRIPQILGVYIFIAWAGLQLFDWALLQFGISPHWAQIFFITVVGIIPSLLVYLNNRERIQQGQLGLGEKVLFPSNFALLGIALFFMFRTADLGATSMDVTFTNADGIEVTETVIKKEFKKRFPVFHFDPIKPDSATAWLGAGIAMAITEKLNTNKYLSPEPYILPANRIKESNEFSTVEKINFAKVWNQDYYIDGNYEFDGKEYLITPMFRNKKTGKIIQQKSFQGDDFITIADSMYLYLCQATGLSTEEIEESPNLNLGETVSYNVEAGKHYILAMTGLGNYAQEMEKAIALDSTFTYAYFMYANHLTRYSRGALEAKRAIDQAMKHRKRAEFDLQIQIMVLKHLIYQEWDKAEKLLNIQLRMDANNEGYNYALSNIYIITGQIDKLVEHAKNRFSEDPNPGTGFQAMQALLMNGEPDKVINRVKTYLLLDQQNIYARLLLAQAQIHQGNLAEAKASLEEITLINPDVTLDIAKTEEAIDYLVENPVSNDFLTKFVGVYRHTTTEMLLENKILGDQIFTRAMNQQGFFMYPAGDNLLKYGSTGKAFTAELLFDQQGKVYGIKRTESYKDEEYIFYDLKQDSIIWNAEALLKKGDYVGAQIAYQKAIDQNPEHFYLYQAKEHLEYLQSKQDTVIQQDFQKIVGQYKDIKIWIEDGLLFYKRPGVARRILRPIADNRFTTLLNYSFNYEFVEKAGKMVGIQGINYNHETKEWEKLDDWYYERTKLLD